MSRSASTIRPVPGVIRPFMATSRRACRTSAPRGFLNALTWKRLPVASLSPKTTATFPGSTPRPPSARPLVTAWSSSTVPTVRSIRVSPGSARPSWPTPSRVSSPQRWSTSPSVRTCASRLISRSQLAAMTLPSSTRASPLVPLFQRSSPLNSSVPRSPAAALSSQPTLITPSSSR